MNKLKESEHNTVRQGVSLTVEARQNLQKIQEITGERKSVCARMAFRVYLQQLEQQKKGSKS